MKIPRRKTASWLFVIALCLVGFFATQFLYENEILKYSVSDAEGHGPDYGTSEWSSGKDSSILVRSIAVGSLTGLAGIIFTTAIAPRLSEIKT